MVLYASWVYARCAGLLKAEVTADMGKAILRRIVIAQAFYAGGAALCVINTWVSIAIMIALQLNYAIAPAYRVRHRSSSE